MFIRTTAINKILALNKFVDKTQTEVIEQPLFTDK